MSVRVKDCSPKCMHPGVLQAKPLGVALENWAGPISCFPPRPHSPGVALEKGRPHLFPPAPTPHSPSQGLVCVALGSFEPARLLAAPHWDAVLPAVPTIALAFVYQMVIPVIVLRLGCDPGKVSDRSPRDCLAAGMLPRKGE